MNRLKYILILFSIITLYNLTFSQLDNQNLNSDTVNVTDICECDSIIIELKKDFIQKASKTKNDLTSDRSELRSICQNIELYEARLETLRTLNSSHKECENNDKDKSTIDADYNLIIRVYNTLDSNMCK